MIDTIAYLGVTGSSCAMRTAVILAVRFDTMADDTAVAMCTHRSECLNCALKTVEHSGYAVFLNGERLIVIVTAQ